MALFDDPNWPRANTLLIRTLLKSPPPPQAGVINGNTDATCNEEVKNCDITLVGVPWYRASLTRGRCDLAPTALRNALERFSSYDVEHQQDLRKLHIHDVGDLAVSEQTPASGFADVTRQLQSLSATSRITLALGGDNSILRPLMHASSAQLIDTGLITLDAHFDLRTTEQGLHNGNPVSALLQDGLPGRNIVQIGIQSFANAAHYARAAANAGIHVVTIERVRREGIGFIIDEALLRLAGLSRLVIDIDLDVLDRVWMPGAPGARPGGLTPLELADAVYRLGQEPRVVAAELVELDPSRDPDQTSVLSGARVLLAFLSGIASRTPEKVQHVTL